MIASVIFACVEKHSAGRDVGGCPDWLQSIVPNDDFGYSDWLDQVMASNETVADTESVSATVSFEDTDWFGSSIQALVVGTDTAGRPSFAGGGCPCQRSLSARRSCLIGSWP